jgi:PBSX family phage terminase large subunit
MKANPNFTYLKKTVPKQRVTLLQGSTRSGKSYAVCYYIIWLCENYKGLEIDITRDTFTALKATIWKDFEDILKACNLYNDKYHNKTDHIYALNGNLISYYGADNPDKIHGRARDILIVNEAHQFPIEVIDQLFPRTRQRIICDYNPALGLEHWLDPYIDKYPPLITTYKDNPYLTASQIEDIESRKNNQYWWQVYGSGQRANREGAIFTNWITGEFDNSLPYCYGQDYGFSVDPTTLVRVAVDKKNKKIYVDECFYNKNQLGTDTIYQLNKSHLLKANDLIIADSAEPRLIDELRRKGLNIRGAIKGQGSVTAGISQMQDYQIIVTERSSNTRKEISNYCWSDKRAGIPIDDYNHCFTGETLITTINGQVPIKDIKEGDLVLTSQGYKKVLVKFNNGLKQVNRYLIQFDTFSVSLCSTKEHKIKTEKEWKQISQLQSNDLLCHYKYLTEKNIDYTQTKDTLVEAVKDYTLKFGSTIRAMFQKATMFIILTAIRIITILPIYLWFMVNYILGLKQKEDLKTIPNLQNNFTQKVLKKLKSGISQQRAKNGIKNIQKKVGLIESIMSMFANNAEMNIKQGTQELQNIAIKTVRLKQIEKSENYEALVYDLMVEDCHEYFANGILVHNCIDGIRYAVSNLSNNVVNSPIQNVKRINHDAA